MAGAKSSPVPSLLFHAAVASLVATALLGDRMTGRRLAFVIGVTLLVDLDTVIGLALPGAHRSLFHNVFFLAGAVAALHYGTRPGSRMATRFGPSAHRVAWTGAAAMVLAGVAPDLFWNGANLLYPVQDRFYEFTGEMFLSLEHGLVQDIFDLTGVGSTDTLHYSTGVDPSPGAEPEGVERKFLVAGTGMQLLLTATGFLVAGARLWETRS